MPRIRVLQYGVGPIGAGIVHLMWEKPDLQIVGAVDVDPAKIGKDLGQVAEVGRDLGLEVSDRAERFFRTRVDVVVHSTASSLPRMTDQLKECVRAGAHVVSTCEELAYPFRKYPELVRELDSYACEHNAVLLGTGVNPGFAMDKLVLTLATACQRVNRVRVRRVVDAGRRRLPLQKKVGAGLTVEEFQDRVVDGSIKHHGLPESAAMLADALGLPADKLVETIEPVIATETVRTEGLEIPAGRVLGVRQVLHGLGNGAEVITLELEMYVAAREPFDAIRIEGVPELNLRIPGGIHGDLATAAIVVNCIPALFEVRPGLRTARDIPMTYFPSLLAQAATPNQVTRSAM